MPKKETSTSAGVANACCGTSCTCKPKSSAANSGSAGALYFVGFVGAIIYWFQAANSFGGYFFGFLKALVWPAYIVYKLLETFYGNMS